MRQLRRKVSIAGLAIMLLLACSKPPNQTEFVNPDEAAKMVLQAFKAEDMESVRAIFGDEAVEIVSSGDPIADRHDRQVLALAMEQSWKWAPLGEDQMELIIGEEQWPFPVLLVKVGDKWRFDSEEGQTEVLARRIGRNELNTIDVCRAYVEMQKEYASRPHDGNKSGLFAQQLRSTPGRQDGLYWAVPPGERHSPLGDLAAEAAADGYAGGKPASSPFRGYLFRTLAAQGAAAPGGRRSYIVDGEMTGGFALVAYPAEYGSSGIMTFIVNQDGIVYEKDLGEDTSNEAVRMTEYDPDETWAALQAPEAQ